MMAEARRIDVFVVAPPRLMLLDIAGPIDALRRANAEQTAIRFVPRFIGPARSAQTSIGIALTGIRPLPRTLPPNAMLVVPGTVTATMDAPDKTTLDSEERRQESAIVDWLRSRVNATHRLVTICSGAILAARAGLFNGRNCTTHHMSSAELSAAAPQAKVLENRLFVRDGNRYSSAGVTSGIDLTLSIISELTDVRCAAAVARYLVVYMRRDGSETQLSPWLEGRNHIHPAVHRVQDAIAANPTGPWKVARLTRIAGTSSRQLTRLFYEHSGMHISDYRNRLRAALARDLLTQTNLDMERVAERAGFASTRQLRRVWKQFHLTSPRETRASGRTASGDLR